MRILLALAVLAILFYVATAKLALVMRKSTLGHAVLQADVEADYEMDQTLEAAENVDVYVRPCSYKKGVAIKGDRFKFMDASEQCGKTWLLVRGRFGAGYVVADFVTAKKK